MDIYKEELTDHYRNPRNKGSLSAPDFSSQLHNPSCGDSCSWQGCISQGRVTALAFDGKGCVISQATASKLSVILVGKTVQECMALDGSFIRNLIGLELGPTRLRCALLPLQALQQGIARYSAQQGTAEGLEHA
jgi:nitrogen fixation NifU-like protein